MFDIITEVQLIKTNAQFKKNPPLLKDLSSSSFTAFILRFVSDVILSIPVTLHFSGLML